MHGRLEDVSEVFLDLIFKISLLENVEGIKKSFAACLKNNVADVNRCRIQDSISALSAILQDLGSSFLVPKKSGSDGSGSSDVKKDSAQNAECDRDQCSEVGAMSATQPFIDSRFVQITADSDEVNRRIAAFIEKQRIRVNFANIQEFCGVEHNEENSCARVDAVFIPRTGSKSHILVRKVVNHCGPQTRDPTRCTESGSFAAPCLGRSQPDDLSSINSGLEERINNMEAHLRICSGGPVPKGVYQRLQELENRLLHLEGISPEYFSQFPAVKRKRASASHHPFPDYQFKT